MYLATHPFERVTDSIKGEDAPTAGLETNVSIEPRPDSPSPSEPPRDTPDQTPVGLDSHHKPHVDLGELGSHQTGSQSTFLRT